MSILDNPLDNLINKYQQNNDCHKGCVYFETPEVSMIGLKCFFEGCQFNIKSLFPLCEPNERIVWIIPPKSTNLQIKSYGSYDPNYRKPTNRGRPPKTKLKLKNTNTIRTTISFFIKSLNPDKPENHVYKIKLYTTGTVNVPGATFIPGYDETYGVKTRKDDYLLESILYLKRYVEDRLYDLTGDKKTFNLSFTTTNLPTINCKSVINTKEIFDRNGIYKCLKKELDKTHRTSIAALKQFVQHYIYTNEINVDILDEFKEVEFRYNKKYLLKLVNEFDISKMGEIFDCCQEFIDNMSELFVSKMFIHLYYKLFNHNANRIYSVFPQTASHRGVKLILILPCRINELNDKTHKIKMRKLHFYKKGNYNTHSKSFKEARWIHQFLNKLLFKYGHEFVEKNDIKFDLVL